MKKTVYVLITLITMLLINGCSSLPFKYEKPSSTTATIYIYVDMPQNINEDVSDPCYEITINEKFVKECMKTEEFMEFKNLKPQSITVSTIRDDIDKKSIKLNLEAGKTYFLQVQSYSQIIGQFNFKQISKERAFKSINSMKMANPPKSKEAGVFDFLTSEDKNEISTSKTDELEKAYTLKEKGILSDEEFKKLKAEILAQ